MSSAGLCAQGISPNETEKERKKGRKEDKRSFSRCGKSAFQFCLRYECTRRVMMLTSLQLVLAKKLRDFGAGQGWGFPQFPLWAQTCPQEELIYSERLRSPPAHRPQRASNCCHHLFPSAAALWNLSLAHPVGFIPRSGSFPRNAVLVQRSFTAHKAPCSSSPALHSSSRAAE